MAEEKKEIQNSLMTVPAFRDIFGDIDFKELNKSIESLADTSKELSDKEKELAVKVVGEWESDVVSRLEERQGEMESMLGFLEEGNDGRHYNYRTHRHHDIMGEEECEALSEKTGTTEIYEVYRDLAEKCEEMRKQELEPPIFGPDETYETQLIQTKEHELKIAKHKIALGRLEKKASEAERDWKKALRSHDLIKDLIARSRRYNRNLSKFTRDCKAKGRTAKLNISISSKDARAALKDLIDFAIKI